jgi:hypothetical protein
VTKKLTYEEGDIFAVPLPSGGWAIAVVARIAPGGRVVVGHFFGPRLPAVPATGNLNLTAQDSILTARFGDLGIVQGSWKRLGRLGSFKRQQWPMPVFHRQVPHTGQFLRVSYRDDNPNSTPDEIGISEQEARRLPEDSLFGSTAIERVLGSMLPERSKIDA